MENINKEKIIFPSAIDLEVSIFKQNLSVFKRLEKESAADLKRVIELSGAENLSTDQKAELLKLAMFYEQASDPGKKRIEALIAGLSFNEGEQMKKLGSAIRATKNMPMLYLFTTLSLVEHWSPDGIVAQSIVSMLQKHIPLIVVGGKVQDFNDDKAIARLLRARNKN